jgi:hypothetical protein
MMTCSKKLLLLIEMLLLLLQMKSRLDLPIVWPQVVVVVVVVDAVVVGVVVGSCCCDYLGAVVLTETKLWRSVLESVLIAMEKRLWNGFASWSDSEPGRGEHSQCPYHGSHCCWHHCYGCCCYY